MNFFGKEMRDLEQKLKNVKVDVGYKSTANKVQYVDAQPYEYIEDEDWAVLSLEGSKLFYDHPDTLTMNLTAKRDGETVFEGDIPLVLTSFNETGVNYETMSEPYIWIGTARVYDDAQIIVSYIDASSNISITINGVYGPSITTVETSDAFSEAVASVSGIQRARNVLFPSREIECNYIYEPSQDTHWAHARYEWTDEDVDFAVHFKEMALYSKLPPIILSIEGKEFTMQAVDGAATKADKPNVMSWSGVIPEGTLLSFVGAPRNLSVRIDVTFGRLDLTIELPYETPSSFTTDLALFIEKVTIEDDVINAISDAVGSEQSSASNSGGVLIVDFGDPSPEASFEPNKGYPIDYVSQPTDTIVNAFSDNKTVLARWHDQLATMQYAEPIKSMAAPMLSVYFPAMIPQSPNAIQFRIVWANISFDRDSNTWYLWKEESEPIRFEETIT